MTMWDVPELRPYDCPRCGLTDDDECDYGGWHDQSILVDLPEGHPARSDIRANRISADVTLRPG